MFKKLKRLNITSKVFKLCQTKLSNSIALCLGFGVCQQHALYQVGSNEFADISTQTSQYYIDNDITNDTLQDEGVSTPPPEAAESRLHGVTLLSR